LVTDCHFGVCSIQEKIKRMLPSIILNPKELFL
jgi:hypothetical protein